MGSLVSGQGTAASLANQQAAQQKQTNALDQQINAQFNSPGLAASNQAYAQSVQNYYTQQLQQQQQVASRNLNFAMARSGLTGGSAASDANTQLQKSYVSGLLNAAQAGQQAEAGLTGSENAQKNSLLGLAASGNLTGSVSGAASQALASGLSNSNLNANALGNVFGSTAQLYNTESNAAAQRKAQQSPFGSLYGNPYG